MRTAVSAGALVRAQLTRNRSRCAVYSPAYEGAQLVRAMGGLTPIVFASIAVLMGCATTTQEDKARLDAADNEKCISYGTTPGTPAYTDCRLKIEHQRAILASQPLPPPQFKDCPTQASGLACLNPSGGR
jgi:hypothetical protein